MKEIDEVIEHHGGWPGAFRVSRGEYRPAEPEVRKVAEHGVTYRPGGGAA
jgi:hypothetical protein